MIVQSRWEEAAQAAALLAKGPEPLRSRFGVGFGTALNLLATRSLDDARAFVQRSFANYLGARPLGRKPRQKWYFDVKCNISSSTYAPDSCSQDARPVRALTAMHACTSACPGR